MGFKVEGKYRVHPTTKLVGALGKVRTTHTQASEEALAANAELRLRQPGGDKQVQLFSCPLLLPWPSLIFSRNCVAQCFCHFCFIKLLQAICSCLLLEQSSRAASITG